jgi:hypothetical protein
MKVYGEVDIWIHIFLISALAGGERSASRHNRFTPGEKFPHTHGIGGWVDRRAGLDDVKKIKFLTLQGLELQHLGHPARSQSLYRLPPLLPAVADVFPVFVNIQTGSDAHTASYPLGTGEPFSLG